mmetsp:Transcript_5381/g.16065  ORF Transcript_5381/g.16065 Transcript_5381/m.16065 type:complete len:173 (+) Transcript_5381:355-873(+)
MKLANVLYSDGREGSSKSLADILSPKTRRKVASELNLERDESIGSFSRPRGALSPTGPGSALSPKNGNAKQSTMSKLYDYTTMVEFMWNQKASTVAIKASWIDVPSQMVPLEKICDSYWVGNFEVPEGCHKYYFVVDGKARLDPKGAVTGADKKANRLIVKDPKKEAKKIGL